MIIERLGSDKKILFFSKYKGDADFINSKHANTVEIVKFLPNIDVIHNLLSKPNEITYGSLRCILDYTSKFDEGVESEIFHAALDIYLERKYYLYDGIEKPEGEIRDEIDRFLKEDEFIDDGLLTRYGDAKEELSPNDLTPEGLGADEIDWDSHDK